MSKHNGKPSLPSGNGRTTTNIGALTQFCHELGIRRPTDVACALAAAKTLKSEWNTGRTSLKRARQSASEACNCLRLLCCDAQSRETMIAATIIDELGADAPTPLATQQEYKELMAQMNQAINNGVGIRR